MKSKSPYRVGIYAFVITAVITNALLTGQFFYDELLDRSFHFSAYWPSLAEYALVISPQTLSICMLSTCLFSGRIYFRLQNRPTNFIRNLLLTMGCLCILGVFLKSFAVPSITPNILRSTYNLHNSKNEKEFIEMMNDTGNKRLFNEEVNGKYPQTSNLPGLCNHIHFLEKSNYDLKDRIVAALEQVGDYNMIKSVLVTSSASKYNLRIKDFTASKCSNPTGSPLNNVRSLLDIYIVDHQIADENIAKFKKAFIDQVFYPIILFLVSINGLVYGYGFRKLNLAIVIVIFFAGVPGGYLFIK